MKKTANSGLDFIKTLGAIHFGGHLMIITTDAALKLTNKYFKD